MVTRIFNTAGLNRPSHLLEKLPEERAIRLLGGAHPDRRAEIFRSLSREAQGRLFDQLNEDAKTSLSRILKYPADQAGSIMTTEFVSVPASWMVKQVIDHIRSSCARPSKSMLSTCLIRNLSAFSLRELLIANPEANIRSASPQKKPITVTPSTDPVDYALNARWNEARGGRSRETGFW